jgi:L-threonylcarbamoyladenylate synthase
MKILDISTLSNEDIVRQTVETLQAGGLILFPTETTYGAGVDALNLAAVSKLLKYKARREGKPLSIAVTDLKMAEQYVEVNDAAQRIYERFLPGPVTVVSKGKGTVAPGVESEFGTLGIRVPDYPLVLELVRQLGRPITATSANASGEKRPYQIQDVLDNLSSKQKELIDLVIDAGELPHNPPSTVIDTTLSTPVIFRQGEVAFDLKEMHEQLSHSEQETKDIAKRMVLKHWNQVKETGLVIGLNGSLGMGKTIFVKGIAEFLHVDEMITSPTYTYVEEYDYNRHDVKGKLFHLDIWKVESEAEMERLGFLEMLSPQHVIVIEWASNMAGFIGASLKEKHLPYFEVEFQDDLTHKDIRILQIKE